MSKPVRKQNSSQNQYHGKEELLFNENSLIGYNQFLIKNFIDCSKFREFSLQPNGDFRTLDFGAGFGTLANIWKESTGNRVECLEIDPRQLSEIQSRGFIGWQSIADIQGKFDFIYSSNVLEHIDEDEKTLLELERLLVTNSRLAIYVPAFMCLFSDMDRTVGHYRRYGRRELITKIEKTGLRVVRCKYVDSVGFFASWAIKIFGWKAIGNIGSAKSLEFYDRYIFPVSLVVDKLTFGRFVGKNLLLVAEKIK